MDKDFNEINHLKEIFPNAVILLCTFHKIYFIEIYIHNNYRGIMQSHPFETCKNKPQTISTFIRNEGKGCNFTFIDSGIDINNSLPFILCIIKLKTCINLYHRWITGTECLFH